MKERLRSFANITANLLFLFAGIGVGYELNNFLTIENDVNRPLVLGSLLLFAVASGLKKGIKREN